MGHTTIHVTTTIIAWSTTNHGTTTTTIVRSTTNHGSTSRCLRNGAAHASDHAWQYSQHDQSSMASNVTDVCSARSAWHATDASGIQYAASALTASEHACVT